MGEEKFINQLLNALNDERVKKKIVNIISSENKIPKLTEKTNDSLLKELEKCKIEKSKLEDKNVQLESQYKKRVQEYENLQQQYKKQIKELEQVCILYKDRYKLES